MYCVFSDVHSNFEALEEVLSAATGEGAERFLFLGDAVGYGPDPGKCAGRIKEISEIALAGNHDMAVTGRLEPAWFNPPAYKAITWTKEHLEPGLLSWLGLLEPARTYEEILLAHGSPRNPAEEYLLDSQQAAANFLAGRFRLCLVGHSHLPLIFESGRDSVKMSVPEHGTRLNLLPENRYIVNPGSAGQPRDGNAKAAYALYDPVGMTIEFRRVAYPLRVTQEKMKKAGLPAELAERLSRGV